MPSKLGIHINFITEADAMRAFILQARPVAVKTLQHDAQFWGQIKSEFPELILIGRRYMESQRLSDPNREAEDMARGILSLSTAHVYDAWEGYNETPRDMLEPHCRFDIRLAELLHEEGVKYVAGSWSVGVPDITDWQEPVMLDALRVADYIGIHEYSAPRMDDPRGLDGIDPTTGWFVLRYRKWYPTLPPDCQKPLLITECGIDSGAVHWDPGAQGGWRSFTDAQGYLEQLAWYDHILQLDDYVAGATIFCWGTLDPGWETFDLSGDMVNRLTSYIQEQAVIEPEPPPPPPPPPPPGGLQGLRERIAELEAENAALRDQLASAQVSIEELGRENATLARQLTEAEARMNEVRRVLSR